MLRWEINKFNYPHKLNGIVTVIYINNKYSLNNDITLNSILDQTYSNYEIIILNSTDFPIYYNETIIKNKRIIDINIKNYNLTCIDKINLGILLSKGEFITFIEDGVIYYSDFIINNIQNINNKNIVFSENCLTGCFFRSSIIKKFGYFSNYFDNLKKILIDKNVIINNSGDFINTNFYTDIYKTENKLINTIEKSIYYEEKYTPIFGKYYNKDVLSIFKKYYNIFIASNFK